MATLYLQHGYLKLARKFITGPTAEQRPGCVGGEVLLKYRGGCERLCWKTSTRIFFSAVKPNYRNAHRQLPSLVCVSQQCSRITQMRSCFGLQGNVFTTAIKQQSIKLITTRTTTEEKNMSVRTKKVIWGQCHRSDIITVGAKALETCDQYIVTVKSF